MRSLTPWSIFLLSIFLAWSAEAKNYPTEPTDARRWQELVESLGDKTYTIQKGDNLWTLSKIFFGDPDYWSKLWAQNKDIWFNPHKISVGDILVFDLGSYTRPPSVRLIKAGESSSSSTETSEEAESQKRVDTSASEAPSHNLPEPGESAATSPLADEYSPIAEYMLKTFPQAEVVKLSELGRLPEEPPERKRPSPTVLPESLPSWVGREIPDHKIQYTDASVQRQIPPLEEWLSCYVDPQQTDEPQRIGEIVGVQDGMHAAHQGQVVFIKSSKNLTPGQTYAVVSWNKVKMAEDQVGVIQVFGGFQITKLLSTDFWEGIVTYALHPVVVGSALSEGFNLSSFRPQAISGALQSFSGEIYSGYCHENRHIFGFGEIIFIKYRQGPKPAVGSQFPIHRGRKTLGLPEPVDRKTEWIGVGQVIRIQGDWLTAYVLDSVSEVRSGDRTRADE